MQLGNVPKKSQTLPLSHSTEEDNKEFSPTPRTRGKPAKFMWELVSPEGRV